MSERSVTHDTFRIERTYDAPPARVFAAWADPAIKSRWFVGPDEWSAGRYELDFRVGGIERTSGGPAGGPVHSYEARYQDIVPNEHDFRGGGHERPGGGPAGGPVHSNEARYQDIAPNEPIVTSYDMHLDGARISVSLATVEFNPEGSGPRLVLTEQGAYLDGHD